MIYIREEGRTRYMSAKTRSWEQAEKFAQAERDKRDPVKMELARIAEKEAEKEAATWPQRIPLHDALEQWLAGLKRPGASSIRAYRTSTNKLLRWAKREGFAYVSDVTSSALDKWVASWSPDATDKINRIRRTTQSILLSRIKTIFQWAKDMKYCTENPAAILRAITKDESQTWPLTPTQFDELLAATRSLDDATQEDSVKVGEHLRAVSLVQRWTGLRVGDVLILPKSALVGNRLTAVIRKKRKRKPKAAVIERVLPDHVADALRALTPMSGKHYFWPSGIDEDALIRWWMKRIDRLNHYLSFVNEDGEPMRFHSHILRDTYAVEMLLAGVHTDKVSKLLCHESVATTERHYAKWTKARKEQLEDEAVEAMRRQGVTVS
jgi:site-specific recombinase XerD